MKMWKKNAIVASILVFVCAGIYLNWMYGQDQNVEDLTQTLNEDKIMDDSALVMGGDVDPLTQAAGEGLEDVGQSANTDYFAAVRLSRQESRDSAVSMLQEAMSYGDQDGQSASQELEALVETSLNEAQIESLVIAKGYADCVAYMSEDGISIAVSAPEGGLQEDDVSLISDVVLSQSSYELEDIRIIEVK